MLRSWLRNGARCFDGVANGGSGELLVVGGADAAGLELGNRGGEVGACGPGAANTLGCCIISF